MTNSHLISYKKLQNDFYELKFELDCSLTVHVQEPTFKESAGDIIMLLNRKGYNNIYRSLEVQSGYKNNAFSKQRLEMALQKVAEYEGRADITEGQKEHELFQIAFDIKNGIAGTDSVAPSKIRKFYKPK